MENYFVEKAERKGNDKVRVLGVVGDIERILKVESGKLTFPPESYVEKMIERYNADVFDGKRFDAESLGFYENVLRDMGREKRLPEFDVRVLRELRVELMSYYYRRKG